MVVPMMVFLCVTCFGLMNVPCSASRLCASEALIGVIVERTTAAHQNMNTIQEEAQTSEPLRFGVPLHSLIAGS